MGIRPARATGARSLRWVRRSGCSVGSELGEQVADAGDVEPGGGRLGGGFVAAGEAPPAAKLGEAVLDLPQRSDGLEALGLVRLAPPFGGDRDLVVALNALD